MIEKKTYAQLISEEMVKYCFSNNSIKKHILEAVLIYADLYDDEFDLKISNAIDELEDKYQLIFYICTGYSLNSEDCIPEFETSFKNLQEFVGSECAEQVKQIYVQGLEKAALNFITYFFEKDYEFNTADEEEYFDCEGG